MIGFIGAGKCGMSLAHYFTYNNLPVYGVASRHEFSDVRISCHSVENILKNCDIIFITVNDGSIKEVWDNLKKYDLQNKIFCHCSGSLSSDILGGNSCSMHPMLAFNSKQTDVHVTEKAFFTVEGSDRAVLAIEDILKVTGNPYKIINKAHKVKYHAAACFASNFVVAVCDKAEELLTQCGFTPEEAHNALSPLMKGNMDNILKCGTKSAVTGPAARKDMSTIQNHRRILGEDVPLYDMLTKIILDMPQN